MPVAGPAGAERVLAGSAPSGPGRLRSVLLASRLEASGLVPFVVGVQTPRELARATQARGVRARVSLDLLRRRRERSPGQRLCLRLPAANADRELGWAHAAARAAGEKSLHAAVLERVERDHGEATPLAQDLPRNWKRAVERVELPVDGDPQCLERPLGGVAAAETVCRRYRGADRLDQLGGRPERPAARDLARDRARMSLLAV